MCQSIKEQNSVCVRVCVCVGMGGEHKQFGITEGEM